MQYDIIVIGAGHAGCEAALAAARMGPRTLLLTVNLDNVAQMSCNPAIGGLAKGHMVREIDALGGEMGKVIDQTGIQFRMLNTGRGRAVQAIRAQADKKAYQNLMRHIVASQRNLDLMQGTVVGVARTGGAPPRSGREVAQAGTWVVKTEAGLTFDSLCLVLSPGTFLNGQLHIGFNTFPGGRAGELSAPHLSRCLAGLGFELGRLKTGTSPRLARRSIDFSKLKPQFGDDPPPFFSFSSAARKVEQVPCHVALTNPRVHELLRANFDKSPLFTGRIKGVGPRYCPSIEDKVRKFPHRDSHQVFLEPEGVDSEEIYASGISTSMPAEIQLEFVRSMGGLESAEIMRPGYAVEYDFIPPTQLRATLQSKQYPALFLAGQINGTSGYEEAAAQGLMAGVNAALFLRNEPLLILDRAEAYIGVMIDDLVTRGTQEPYRMFTSQAEYRLLLRHDNADERLMARGHKLGLVADEQFSRSCARSDDVRAETSRLENSVVNPQDANRVLASVGGSKTDGALTLEALLKRPEVTYRTLREFGLASGSLEVGELVEIRVKYAGYIRRQEKEIEQFRGLESLRIPEALYTEDLGSISKEARERLLSVRPVSVGQASRLAGVSPGDVSALIIYLKSYERITRIPAEGR